MATREPLSARTAAVVAVIGTAAVSYIFHQIRAKRLLKKCQELRQAERKGRIRAEVQLRQLLKQASNTTQSTDDDGDMSLACIGTIVSPYTKRMGTPRQGALAPSSRGILQLKPTVAKETLDGIHRYSHVWIIFQFHANTDLSSNKKTKVKPPRAPCKVGQLATRSPHRPNALGLSLIKVERVEDNQVYLSALDLVNGTPVYDIKPCVPWDIPQQLVVPEWVSQEDALSRVEFTKTARDSLAQLVLDEMVSPVYKKEDAHLCERAICEILAQDPRSGHKRGVSSHDPYNIVFGRLQVQFLVQTEDLVQVVDVSPFDFSDADYVDGIPLVSSTHL